MYETNSLVSLGFQIFCLWNMQLWLVVAVTNEHIDVTQYLVSHGASIDIKDNDGVTPRDIASADILAVLLKTAS